MIRLIAGIVLCMGAVDSPAPLWFVVPVALLGLTLAALGVRKLRR
jgi:hypothetical protein